MGMYTGLRGWIKFKKEYHDDMSHLCNDEEYVPWDEVLLDLRGVEERDVWCCEGRSRFIPFGAVCYMPDDWDVHQPPTFIDGKLSFTCSLKNYNGEIEKFLNLLKLIATSWSLERLYEEAENPIILEQKEETCNTVKV